MMDSNQKQSRAGTDGVPVQPSAREHGVDGYTDGAVGGFGEGYEQQVAHGAESDEPAAASDSELDAQAGAPALGPRALEQAVRKTLARAHIDAADLRVEAVGSEVRLSGTVRHPSEKAELESRARAVPGVASIVSDLAVLRADWENT